MKKNSNILFIIFFALLLMPLVFSFFKTNKKLALKGSIEKPLDPSLNRSSWFSQTYQEEKEEYLKANFGLRNIFTRIDNQIRYSAFDEITAKRVVEGKNNIFYETGYINAYLGLDSIGEEQIENKVNKLKTIQDSLENKGKHLLVILASGKASFFPDQFPPKYDQIDKKISNYDIYKDLLLEEQIKHIDFNAHFKKLKSTSKAPLYPKGGIHWSKYADYLVADSLISYFQNVLDKDIPELVLDSIEYSKAKGRDKDLLDGMNVLWNYDKSKLAYPKYHFEQKEKYRPRALIIADSYYWGLYNDGFTWGPFGNSHFWFYNKEIYPKDKFHKSRDKINFEEEVRDRELIILMATEANLYKFAYGFIDEMYDYVTSSILVPSKNENEAKTQKDIQENKITETIAKIKANPKWYEHVQEKAKKNNTSLEKQLRDDALYFLENQ